MNYILLEIRAIFKEIQINYEFSKTLYPLNRCDIFMSYYL